MQSDRLKLTVYPLAAPATGCGFAGAAFAVADGDGHVHLLGLDEAILSNRFHDGAILSFACDEKTGWLYSAGDDGKVLRCKTDVEPEVLHEGRKWVDWIASSPRGHVAWAAGKSIYLLRKGTDKADEIQTPSSEKAKPPTLEGVWISSA
ncbi:MAG: hypothetical protein AAFR27_08120, partial [Pseudomonadota bacterium]